MNIRISLTKDIIQAGCTNFKIIGKMGSHKIPKYELKMLAAKHLSIMPKYDRNDYARIGFQVEKAYWEYINQYPDAKEMEDKTFPLKEFCIQIFRHVSFLRNKKDIVGRIVDYFKEYKQRVPTYGVIVFNRPMDKVVMVKSYGARSWNFPKGKVNEKEAGHDCAAREVAEEIGINLDSKLDPDSWIEKVRIE